MAASTDIGCSDHFLVWMEFGKLANRSRKEKHIIKRRLDRFTNEEVKVSYQEALKAEVNSFSESIKNKVQKGIK